jgi:hypothetical protein
MTMNEEASSAVWNRLIPARGHVTIGCSDLAHVWGLADRAGLRALA